MFNLYLDRDESSVKEPEDFLEYYRFVIYCIFDITYFLKEAR